MRARDVRAIIFCVVTTLLLFLGLLTFAGYLVALGGAGAYGAFVATRPRMLRVFHRLRGEPDWSGYFDNGGERARLNARAPAGSSPPARPAARR